MINSRKLEDLNPVVEEKAAFAEAMISANMNPLEAGQLVHPANFNRAAQIASMWHNDAEVKAMIAELKKAEIAESGVSEDERYVEEKLKEIIADQLNVDADSITAESRFKEDLEADSLDLFELVMALEEEYGVEIPSEDLEKILTVQDVIDYMKNKGVEA